LSAAAASIRSGFKRAGRPAATRYVKGNKTGTAAALVAAENSREKSEPKI